ncbi:transcriptional repressor [Oceanotoga sp. DSM 15011]|jgi:Fur family ferric uptake transcriptional regulator|uniref:Fur family ferric uptake transcriptional regulator n=1 Tax=Oceanotoga teriensis TaxID=515440 RepID=A0AA45C7X9_9BACT|nr:MULTISPECIES: transcriptional repressor [Oceanotoga]MDN5342507.1 Fur family transcriptional regulator, ferric uptake regulator [Oceanotoga sp.]MDO7977493.1 transcriptional repressor [Oceanotoga teriensis]PWJ95639.1 Fur family ferric uptake transcriptional regulator [Oceanotoga teriensis]UYO99473.1 transcriptional repressor [Oceanotoga sp. DSM 15011]
MKLTKARRDILEIFKNSNYPLSAEQLFELLKKEYDLSTIYRNLNFFEKNSALKSIVFSDKVKYFYSGEGHFHFIYCVKCKKFEKFDLCYEDKISQYIKENLKFEILNHTLYFEGICQDCRN